MYALLSFLFLFNNLDLSLNELIYIVTYNLNLKYCSTISYYLLKSETNYCLILIKKFLEEIDWAHNFVQYVKQEFDELLYRQ